MLRNICFLLVVTMLSIVFVINAATASGATNRMPTNDSFQNENVLSTLVNGVSTDGAFGAAPFNRLSCAIRPTTCEESTYRSLDGSCNHLDIPEKGMANNRYARLLPPKYGDGVSSPTISSTGDELPNSRLVSVEMFGYKNVPDPQYTLMNMQWGQIVTHDLSMQAGGTQSTRHPTRCCTDSGNILENGTAPATCLPILVLPNDPLFSQHGIKCLNFVRTLTDFDANCTQPKTQAEQLNVVTSYLDLSLIYGSSVEQNNEIREFQGGRMILEERNGTHWLPLSRNRTSDCDSTTENDICYRAGDSRVNQNTGLTILHTILVREHNRIATKLAKLNSHWNDDTLFEEARRINIAQFQYITYYEWLPIFLGYENMLEKGLIYNTSEGNYINDFDTNEDPSILNSHATAAFRYFHTQIGERLDLMSELRSIKQFIHLSEYFNRPGILEIDDNFDSLTRGHSTQPQALTDNNFYRETRSFLLGRNSSFSFDLRAIDIQRNRDHGLASYNDFRELCGLKRAKAWNDFGEHIQNDDIERLKKLYASPEDVDLTVGGSLEFHEVNALAGPTFLYILTEQFYRTRVADRFFFENYQNGLTLEQLFEIRNASMARLLCDNGNGIAAMQPRAFWLVSETNTIMPCSNIPEVNLTKWLERKE